MLTLRKEQKQAFVAERRLRFEDRVLAYLREAHAAVCAAMGEADARASIRLGMERANEYGLTDEHDVVRYIDAMYRLGPSFDTDPRFPWAEAALCHPALSPRAKMDLISIEVRRARR